MTNRLNTAQARLGELERERETLQAALVAQEAQIAEHAPVLAGAQAAAVRQPENGNPASVVREEALHSTLTTAAERTRVALAAVEAEIEQVTGEIGGLAVEAKEARIEAIRKEAGELADRIDAAALVEPDAWAELGALFAEGEHLKKALGYQQGAKAPFVHPHQAMLARLNYIIRQCGLPVPLPSGNPFSAPQAATMRAAWG